MKRLTILQRIFENFQQISQWIPNNFDNAFEYYSKADALIQLLEVEDCGSVGGFDGKNPLLRKTNFPLYNRFLTVLRKQNKEKDIKSCCGFTVKSLGIYFDKLSKLRENS